MELGTPGNEKQHDQCVQLFLAHGRNTRRRTPDAVTRNVPLLFEPTGPRHGEWWLRMASRYGLNTCCVGMWVTLCVSLTISQGKRAERNWSWDIFLGWVLCGTLDRCVGCTGPWK